MTSSPSALEILGQIREGRSVVAVVEESLKSIAEHDDVAAWVHVDAEGALTRAGELDALTPRQRASLPLCGVPVGVKDIIDTSDMPTAMGSPMYAGRRPSADAAIVASLRAAGAVIIGKTATTEFACFAPAATRNPLDVTRTPGGSSSGSAAAVAAGHVPLAVGTQTAGSVIRPASYCGVFGFKPTAGLLARAGVLATSETLDTLGLFARVTEDLDLAINALTDSRFARTSRPLQPVGALDRAPRLGVIRWGWDRLEPPVRAALDALIDTLQSAGAAIEVVEMPTSLEQAAEAQFTIQWFETAAALEHEVRTSASQLSQRLRDDLALGGDIPTSRYLAARRYADEWRWQCADTIQDFDAVLSPSTLGVPPLGLESTGDPLFCRPWTLFGFPALAIPAAWTTDGLPAGGQLITSPQADQRLLHVASWIANVTN